MKTFAVLLALAAAASGACAQGIAIQKITGEVSVRHGVTEIWTRVAPGDVLKPDDTMKTGKKGGALLAAQLPGTGIKRISLPAEVIVDLSDIRQLTPEELMLKLTMEKVRSSSYQWKNDELHIPNAAVVHGASGTQSAPPVENDPQTGVLQFNGAKVLYDNGFYSTCALRALELFRRYPSVAARFENRLVAAQALEKADLRGEALNEYGALLAFQGLTPDQRALVQSRMELLRK